MELQRNIKPHLRAIDGQSLKEQFSGIKMETIVNQKVGQVHKRNVLVLKWSQIQSSLKTGNSKSAVSYCSPVESSFIEYQPDGGIWLKNPKYLRCRKNTVLVLTRIFNACILIFNYKY